MNSLATIGLLAGAAAAETVRGVVVFSRHGDRTTKHYGSQQLTPLGATQNFQVGSDYRSRYLESDSDHQIRGISQDELVQSQIYASAPNQAILSNTATAFLQGLYPPLSGDDFTEQLNNGSDSSAPLDGYQYVLLQGMDEDSPDTIWIKGDDACPAYVESSESFTQSEVFSQRVEDTRDFYRGMSQYLEDVYDITEDYLSYENAYNIFDLINVARIHNESSPALDISDEDMFQLRTLADSHEFGSNFNASQPARAIGAKTLMGGVLAQLNETVASEGKLKFSLLAGSYDTFLAFFGLTELASLSHDFEGLPEYASTMAFELLSDDDSDSFPAEEDLKVRWLFKNGTSGDIEPFPLFGQDGEVLSYSDFRSKLGERAITDVGTWCDVCSATEDFCAAYTDDGSDDSAKSQKSGGSGGMSNAVAGVIGAMVTLAVVAIAGAVAFVVMRKKKQGALTEVSEKRSQDSGSGRNSIA